MSECSAVSRLRMTALAGTAAIALTAGSANAQDTSTPDDPPAGESSDDRLETIVVTAERRATNLQDTPLSVVAMTEETVAAKGIEDLQDLAVFTPNLSITASRGNGNNTPNFTIRGISGGGGATGERGVGLYIDGVYVPRTSGSVLRVLDIERVEVLRGPQGTLFGRNSTGGAIRIFSKQPEDEFEGYVRGTVGNFDRHDVIGCPVVVTGLRPSPLRPGPLCPSPLRVGRLRPRRIEPGRHRCDRTWTSRTSRAGRAGRALGVGSIVEGKEFGLDLFPPALPGGARVGWPVLSGHCPG